MTGFKQDAPREKGCLYLEEQENKTFKCLIISEDLAWDDLDNKVKRYFESECKNYPNPEDPGQCPPHQLPDKCTYRMIWVDE